MAWFGAATTIRLLGLALALAALLQAPAHAQGQTCQGFSASPLSFNSYIGAKQTSTSTLTVNCAPNQNNSIGLNAGSGGGSVTTRIMKNGTSSLSYQMFQNLAGTINWGNTAQVDAEANTSNGQNQSLTVYGTLAAGQFPTPGIYTDTISATVLNIGRTTTFTVSATVLATCTIGANPLGFGSYTGAVNLVSTVISVKCTKTTPYNVGLSAGNAPGATVTARKMQGGNSATLAYNLFQDAARTKNWGNSPSVDAQAGTGTGAAQGLYVYGQIPSDQFSQTGSYSDIIIATLTY